MDKSDFNKEKPLVSIEPAKSEAGQPLPTQKDPKYHDLLKKRFLEYYHDIQKKKKNA